MTIHLVDKGEGKSGELSEIAGLSVLHQLAALSLPL
jgi:hypothetical protein